MADAQHDEAHEDHGNTLAAWFLTLSWIVVWTIAGVAIIVADGKVVLWTVIALVASVIFAVIAGVMKKAGMGRTEPRPTPQTREEWEAERAAATTDGKAEDTKGDEEGDKEPATAAAK
ncbi:bacteriorhodopsin [Nocardiopsis mwathae]|uniref:Bacteriorhodopsin n=1 Tax=Nocardiopsis mwathae TaxID=1472723 RepID=A0A7W9YHV6_9ACTN|nr:HGxxPAAW family protein [Nocardiopsis mwathae]MBB6172379.1 bacteriorhodopsin [Nocardiopsis mwathae]